MNTTARDLYLDLLIKVIANTIYEDPAVDPWVDPTVVAPFQSELRYEGKDWPSVAHTMVGVQRLENLRMLAQQALDDGIPGDFIEAGIWRGGCCILMRGILAANQIANRKVYAVDSFEGLPPPNPQTYPADEGWNFDRHKHLAVSPEEVRNNFSRYGLLDEQVVFVKGWFQDTLPALTGPFCVIRLDGDWYESTYVALEALYPKLSPGGFIILDDFNFLPPCQKAVTDYRSRHGITAPMNQVDWNSSWWRKN
jgi:O-methyltransferase